MEVGDIGVFKFEELPKSHRSVPSILDDLPALDVGMGTEVNLADAKEVGTFRAAIGRWNKAHGDRRLVLRQLQEGKFGVYCVDPETHPAPVRAPRGQGKKKSKKSAA